MAEIEINLNHTVKVRLTKLGRDILKQNFEKLKRDYPPLSLDYRPKKEDAKGWSEWQLHTLMSTFGKHLVLGFDVPFETTILYIEEER